MRYGCKKCGQDKSVAEFYMDYKRNVPRSICKECHLSAAVTRKNKDLAAERHRQREIYSKNKDRIRENQKRYNRSEKGKATIARGNISARATGRAYAYLVVQRAVKSKKLEQKNICSSCFEHKKTSFHHVSGYDKQNRLNVVEICSSCHGKEHRHSISL